MYVTGTLTNHLEVHVLLKSPPSSDCIGTISLAHYSNTCLIEPQLLLCVLIGRNIAMTLFLVAVAMLLVMAWKADHTCQEPIQFC